MLSFFYRLVTSVWPHRHVYEASSPEPALEDEWIAIIPDVEDGGKAQIDDELALLRKRNSSRDRAFILERVSEILSKRDLSNLTQVVLPGDLRRKIYKDVFMKLSADWLESINRIYPDLLDLEANWTPSTYEKNILGQIIDMAEQTGPTSLSASGFAKMLKNVHLCVTQSLAHLTKNSVSPGDSELLLEMLTRSIVPIIDLWITTTKQSQESLSRQGRLPEKWTQTDEEYQKQLIEKKASGQIDARFIDGEDDELRRRYINRDRIEKGLFINHESMTERRRLLQEQLYNCKKKVRIQEIDRLTPDNFKERRAQLAELLKKKLN